MCDSQQGDYLSDMAIADSKDYKGTQRKTLRAKFGRRVDKLDTRHARDDGNHLTRLVGVNEQTSVTSKTH